MITELPAAAIRVEAELGARPAILLSRLAKLRRLQPSELASELLEAWLQEHGEAAITDASLLRAEEMDEELRQLERRLGPRTGRPRRTPTTAR